MEIEGSSEAFFYCTPIKNVLASLELAGCESFVSLPSICIFGKYYQRVNSVRFTRPRPTLRDM
jgi:hypothetical protein